VLLRVPAPVEVQVQGGTAGVGSSRRERQRIWARVAPSAGERRRSALRKTQGPPCDRWRGKGREGTTGRTERQSLSQSTKIKKLQDQHRTKEGVIPCWFNPS
jgi:hypothetical protein